jgi:hypothetical protein
MRLSIKSQTPALFAATGTLVLALLSACASGPTSAPVINTATPETVGAGSPSEVIVYASDLSSDALVELDFVDDSDSPGGSLIGLPN